MQKNQYIHIEGIVFHPYLPYLISCDETRSVGEGQGNPKVQGNLLIWDLEKEKCIHTIPAHDETIYSLVLSPDLQYLVTSSKDNTVKIWRIIDVFPGIDPAYKAPPILGASRYANPENAPVQDPDSIYFADIDSKNRYVLYGSKDTAIYLYDLENEKILCSLHGHIDTPYCVRWIRDTPFAISASSEEIKIWDTEHKTCISTIPMKAFYTSSRFGLAGNSLILASGDKVEAWTIEKIEPISLDSGLLFDNVENATKRIKVSELLEAHINRIQNLIDEGDLQSAYQAFKALKQEHPSFKRHAIVRQMAVRLGARGRKDGIDDIWLDTVLSWKDSSFGSYLCGLDVSMDSKKVIASSLDGVIIVADITSKLISGVLHSNDSVGCIRFAGLDRALTGLRGSAVSLWGLNDLEKIDLFEHDDKWGAINEIDYCEKTDHVAYIVGSILGGSVGVYDLSTKEVLLEQKNEGFFFQGARFCSICLSHDGDLLLAGDSSGKIRLWDISQKKQVLTIRGHSGALKYLKFCRSGMMAISVGDDNIIRLWDLKFAHCIRSIKYEPGGIQAVCLADDETYLIILDSANTISLWNLNTFQCDKKFKPDIPIKLSHLGITPDGKYLVAGGEDRTICTLGIEWGYNFLQANIGPKERQPRRLHLPDGSLIEPSLGWGHSSDISALTVSGLRYLISGSFDCRVKVWDILKDGICISTLEGHRKKINAILASSSHDQIISASDDATVIVWSFGSGLMQQTLNHSAPVNDLAINQAYDILVTGCNDGTIHKWNPNTGVEMEAYEEKGSIETMLITSNDKYLVTGTDRGEVSIRNFFSMVTERTFDIGHGTISKILESQERLYVGCASGLVKIIDLGRLEPAGELNLYARISDMYLSGSDIVICNSSFNSSSVQVIDTATGDVKSEIKNIGWIRAITDYFLTHCFIGLPYGHILMADIRSGNIVGFISAIDDHTLCTKISSDRNYLISGHNGGFKIWNLHTGELNEFKDMHDIVDVDFSSDVRFAYVEDYSGNVQQIDLETKQIVKDYGYASIGNLNAATFTRGYDIETFESDKFTIAIRNEDGILYFKELKANELENFQDKEIYEQLRNSRVRYITTSSFRSRGFGHREEIILLDMYQKDHKGREIVLELDKMAGVEFNKAVDKAIISWDSGLLVAKHLDGIVRVWRIETKELVQTIADDEIESHDLGIMALFNENVLIVGCSNGKIKLWNLNTAKLLASFEAHSGPISSISISPDRNLIISSSRGDGIKIWSFDDFRLMASIFKINSTDYALATPTSEFYVSNPKYIQFYQVRRTNDAITRTLIDDEECRTKCLRYFVDIKHIRESIEIK